jgi:hypothetical protein
MRIKFIVEIVELIVELIIIWISLHIEMPASRKHYADGA